MQPRKEVQAYQWSTEDGWTKDPDLCIERKVAITKGYREYYKMPSKLNLHVVDERTPPLQYSKHNISANYL